MGYLVGLLLSLSAAGLAVIVGLDRDRAFYPTVMIVIAVYYVLFAVMGGSERALILEIVVGTVFLLAAIVGFKTSLWFVAIALVGHGVFDAVHPMLFEDPGVPRWWPSFCAVFDVIFGGQLVVRMMMRKAAR